MLRKEPLHPGKIAFEIIRKNIDRNVYVPSIACRMGIDEDMYIDTYLKDFFEGKRNIDYDLAYKLVNLLPRTTMEFWLNTQKDYDDWLRDFTKESADYAIKRSFLPSRKKFIQELHMKSHKIWRFLADSNIEDIQGFEIIKQAKDILNYFDNLIIEDEFLC